MIEAEWLACCDPGPMLKFLYNETSERKSRLFACACCRLIWNRLTAARSRRAVETAERYADGLENRKALLDAKSTAWNAVSRAHEIEARRRIDQSTCVLSSTSLMVAAYATDQWVAHILLAPYADPELCSEKYHDTLVEILRDIFGNPFRVVTLAPVWLSWRDGIIPRLAQAIYDERAFDRIPILADALEDAGCDNDAILNHCRQSGEHVRGCWVIDLLLGKE